MRLLWTAGAVVFIVAIALLAIWASQRRLIYFPDTNVPAPVAAGLSSAETVTFPSADAGSLHGWFLASPRQPTFTVIVFNGNGGNRAYRAPLAGTLLGRGLNVLLFDYRGYGENAGTPTQKGLEADARAARAYVLTRADVDPDRIVYFGESLGTAVATILAAEHAPAALILRSPFTSMADVGQFHYPILPVRLLLRDRFSSIEAIGRVRAPVLVIAGDRDRIVPLEYSRRLYDSAPDPKQLVVIPGADHNDLALLNGEPMIASMLAFLDRVPKR